MNSKVGGIVIGEVLARIDRFWEEEVSFLQQIGRYQSTLGNEKSIQGFMAQYFRKELGLETDQFVPDLKKLSSHPGYSPVEWSYEGRTAVVGQWKTSGPKIGRSLILQGHVDVVSPEPLAFWSYNPWGSTIVGDRMYGRGLQDMKGGIAAMIFAVKAIRDAGVELGADVLLETVIEEECTGNFALATLDKGYVADGALIPEPFGPSGLLAQVGVIWLRVRVTGSGSHVDRADQAVNAIEKAYILINALNQYSIYINSKPKHKDFSHLAHPLNVNIGIIRAGDWPSTVPSECIFEARVGFYPGENPQEIKNEVKDWLIKAAKQDDWLREAEPEITFYGFHAEGVALNKNLDIFKVLGNAHRVATASELEYGVTTATTDIRFYNLYFDVPATCYGPSGGNMHGPDEWVDLPSVKAVTRTLAAYILEWCGVRES
ncbi:MAG: ArgE/DapE family deacylase [Desulfitobacteriaceae bacterium]